ncbi:MAG: peptide deformylase [Chloroflexi bacterium]|nr:peptide deformylase [Chloroflexota bacterium]MCI0578329.1 peptide deformylase [Chloroflexota bacterium]MCI0649003.1 peptide deformylase [Chloroflexota bacterium]MCI0729438.1 peptide deformylase [Chloroflexota bacterium]
MAVLKIETLNNEILRKKARPVTKFDADLQKLIDDMVETMRSASGVGLAGPQVNQQLRLAVVESLPEQDEEGQEIEGSRQLFVLINPEIIWKSRDVVEGIEGCLSIPGWVGEVSRHQSIRVRAQDRHGKKLRLRFSDWTARIVQHEIDHLDGILYIDKLTAPEKIWREEEFYEQQGDEEENKLAVG